MRGSAGGFVGVSGCDYAPYSHGANIFLTEDRVCARSISWELKGAVITYKIISTFFLVKFYLQDLITIWPTFHDFLKHLNYY